MVSEPSSRLRLMANAVTGSTAWPFLILTLSMALFGSNHVLGRAVEGIVPPIGLSFWRWFVATLILLPFTYRKIVELRVEILGAWKIYLLLAFCISVIGNAMVYLALNYTTAINAGIVASAQPATTFVFSWLFFRERTTRGQALGLVIALLGVVMIVIRGDMSALTALKPNTGDLWMLVSVVGFASYAVLLQLAPRQVPTLVSLNVIQFMGAIVLAPFYIWESNFVTPMEMNLPTIGAVLWAGAAVALAAMALWNYAIAYIGANVASPFVYVRTLFAATFAIILLGETLQLYHIAAFVLVVSGILVVTRNKPASV